MLLTNWTLARAFTLAGILLVGVGTRSVAQELPVTEVGFVFRFSRGPVEANEAAMLPSVLRQRLTLTLHRVTVEQALREIAARVRLDLSYSRAVVPLTRVVSVAVENGTTAEALRQVFRGVPVELWVAKNGKAALVPMTRDGKTGTGSGRIVGRATDAKTNEKLAGVEVFLNGTGWRATTDSNGQYRLVDIDSGSYVLTARRLGYARQQRQVAVRAEREDTINIALERSAVALDELVSTATGQQRRRDLGNAITTIRADSVLQTAPIRSLTDLLEDRVPGLTVQHTSGAPGDPARLRLRGLSSVLRGNDPVLIVDGVRVYASQSGARNGNLTNLGCTKPSVGAGGAQACLPGSENNFPAPSPLDQIDPNIIDKIEIFKGPSAATLYGADAANGVIVITTKTGRPGPTRWNARIVHGRTDTPGRWPEGYFRWGHIEERGGAVQFCTLTQPTCIPDSLVRFQALNDPALTALDKGHRTALSLTASGGTQALTYNVTASYGDETGLLVLPALEAERFHDRFTANPPAWMQRPHQLEQWSVTSAVRALLGPTAELTLKASVARTRQERASVETQIALLAGIYVDKVNNLYYVPGPIGASVIPTTNFLQEYYRRISASTTTFTTGLTAQWRPLSWMRGSATVGLNVIPREDEMLLPSGFLTPTDGGALVRGSGRSLVSNFDLQGTIHRPLGWGFAFETSVGANLVTTSTNDIVVSAFNLPLGTSGINGASTFFGRENQANTSVFGWYIEPRISGERLSLSTGIRLDGGSAYGARVSQTGGNLLSLPKLNGSWVISEEPFFPLKSLFSSLRLRAAYGQAQVQPGPGDRLRTYTGFVQLLQPQFKLTTVGNSQLLPERSVEFEGGIDADLLDNRVSLELTAYRKTQVDAHMAVALPLSVNGGGTTIQNIGNILNTGLEIGLGITPLQTQALTWNTRLVYSRNKNTLVKLGDGVLPNKVEGLVEGYPVRGRWARPILGYADQNGDEVLQRSEIQIGDSLVYMGRLHPAYTTALFTNVALFGGMIGITAGLNYESGATQIDQTARSNWVLSSALVDPTTPFGEQAAVLAMDSTEYGLTQDISTFRFNEFSVNYRAPARVAQLLKAQQLTIGIQGRNLGLHSTYRGKDPDVSNWNSGETIRDTGQLPLPRTWQLSVSLQY